MKRRNNREPSECMEYPFGFGFELMNNPRALKFFFSLDDEGKRALMKSIQEIESREEMRGFLEGIVQQIPSPPHGKTP